MSDSIQDINERISSLTSFMSTFMIKFSKYTHLKTSLFAQTKFITDYELSQLLKLDQKTLGRYRRQGKISFYKIHGKILYKESDVLDILEKNYHPAFKKH